MGRAELLEVLNGSPDGPLRLLRRIKNNAAMIAGNHNCRRALVDAGFATVTERIGQHYRLAITERGLQALEA